MTLLLSACALLTIVVVLARGRTGAVPGLLIGTFFTAFALLGGDAWNWSRDSNGAGLPASIAATPSVTSLGSQALLSASVGSLLGALISFGLTRQRFSVRQVGASLQSRKLVATCVSANVTLFLLWLAGQGTNVWYREDYLQTNGVQSLLTATSLIGPLVGIGSFFILNLSGQSGVRRLNWIITLLWWVATIAVGSRLGVGFVIAALIVCLIRLIQNRSFFKFFTLVAAGYGLSWLTLASFTVSYDSRSTTHGISQLGRLFASGNVPHLFQLSDWLTPLKGLVSSIAAAYPLTEQSVLRSPDLSIIVANLNPLPSSLISVDAYSHERLWPWVWVPLGFIGELYGAAGTAGVVGLFAAVAIAAGVGAAWLQRQNISIGVVIVLVLTVALGFLCLQYPSRLAGRLISFATIGPFLLLALVTTARIFAIKGSQKQQRAALRLTPSDSP